jgi:hypothetical protein
MPFLFEKLAVYQKSASFADKITELTRSFPRGAFFLADQLNRAAVSIAANIAEGNRRFTKAACPGVARSHTQRWSKTIGEAGTAKTSSALPAAPRTSVCRCWTSAIDATWRPQKKPMP